MIYSTALDQSFIQQILICLHQYDLANFWRPIVRQTDFVSIRQFHQKCLSNYCAVKMYSLD